MPLLTPTPTATERREALRPLHTGFLRSAEDFPERPALEVGGETLTYAELHDRAAAIAATLQRESPPGPPLVAVYASRSATAFAGVLGILLSGRGYVPLNPSLPPERNRLMLERAGCRAIVADAASAAGLDAVLPPGGPPMTIVVPDAAGPAALPLEPAASWTAVVCEPSSIAYVLFTSGSTGIPKGVTVLHRNVAWLIDTMVERYGIDETDRVSQTHELTFDVSVWDMFVTWERGGCLCCPSHKELISPGRFINRAALSVWFSVPSTAILMKRLGQLKPGSYQTLRLSLFAGEPLPAPVADAWLRAAPNAELENLYGPTELTIVCMGYRWDAKRTPGECEAGSLPIGWPLDGNEPLVVDADMREVPPGGVGELLVSGPQVAKGYWRDPERTAAAFIAPPGSTRIHYRTGDRVRRPSAVAPMTYLGRLDHQIKVRGVRVELGEVEALLREETGVDAVVAVAWPRTATGADGIVAFVGDTGVDVERTLRRLGERLPAQMVPRSLQLLPELPLNASGKFDRMALLNSLEPR